LDYHQENTYTYSGTSEGSGFWTTIKETPTHSTRDILTLYVE